MSAAMNDVERRAFNDGLQAALLAICVDDFPICSNASGDAGAIGECCGNVAGIRKQLCARIKALRYNASKYGDLVHAELRRIKGLQSNWNALSYAERAMIAKTSPDLTLFFQPYRMGARPLQRAGAKVEAYDAASRPLLQVAGNTNSNSTPWVRGTGMHGELK